MFLPSVRFFLVLLALVCGAFSAVAEDYRLAPNDRLDIRLGEWNNTTSDLRDWSTLSGEYVVGADGGVSLPFAGPIQAEGLTTVELGREISRRIQARLGASATLDAVVQIAEYRPVFVTGAVETPGAYPYSPGLTVLKAVALAGGLPGASEDRGVDRDYINARGSLDVLSATRNQLLAASARLQAELTDAEEIEFSETLENSANGKALMDDQRALLMASRNRLKQELAANADLQTLLETEIAALEKKEATQNQQLALTREELESVSQLKDQGLARNQNIRPVRQSVVDIETSLLDIQTAGLRARQDLNRAKQQATALVENRMAELAREKQTVDAQLEETGHRARTSSDLMANALAGGVSSPAMGDAQINYAIVRDEDGAQSEIAADENTGIRPGDVIKVTAQPTTIGEEG